MPWKSIAVFVGVTSLPDTALRYAVQLAERNRAHLIGLHLVPSVEKGHPADSFVRGHDAIVKVIERYKSEERQARETALDAFTTAIAGEDISAEFRIIGRGEADKEANLNALHADLVVVGAAAIGALPDGMSAEMLLLATGVPVLIVPDDWNASQQARSGDCSSGCIRSSARASEECLYRPHAARRESGIAQFRSAAIVNGIFINSRAITEQADALVRKFRVKAPGLTASMSALSGGKVQRAVLARELSHDVRLLIASNPTFGLDFVACEKRPISASSMRETAVPVCCSSRKISTSCCD